MNRIDARFAELKGKGRTGLIPFVTAGDPLPDAMVDLLHALVAAGADLIELGVPFSDPMADGQVIQHASERALTHGVGLQQIFGWVRNFRTKDSATPVVLMGYMNPVEIRGVDRFARDAVEAGVDGVLLVDCPIEESEAASPLRAAGLSQILLAAPTTSDARLEHICAAAQGFLYYVSFAGVTGARQLNEKDVSAHVDAIRQLSQTPVAVGFGISDAASAAAIGSFADAVVIGSALVDRLAGSMDAAEVCARTAQFLAPIRAALDAQVRDTE